MTVHQRLTKLQTDRKADKQRNGDMDDTHKEHVADNPIQLHPFYFLHDEQCDTDEMARLNRMFLW